MNHNLEYFGYSVISKFLLVLDTSYVLSHENSPQSREGRYYSILYYLCNGKGKVEVQRSLVPICVVNTECSHYWNSIFWSKSFVPQFVFRAFSHMLIYGPVDLEAEEGEGKYLIISDYQRKQVVDQIPFHTLIWLRTITLHTEHSGHHFSVEEMEIKRG